MIYRAIRKLKAVLYHAIVEPDIKRSFAECGKDSHIDSGGDFSPCRTFMLETMPLSE